MGGAEKGFKEQRGDARSREGVRGGEKGCKEERTGAMRERQCVDWTMGAMVVPRSGQQVQVTDCRCKEQMAMQGARKWCEEQGIICARADNGCECVRNG